MELKIRRRYGISVLAIHRDGSYIVSPEAEQLLQEGDVLLVLGKLEDIEKMERVWNEDGKRRFEITAKGKRYTIR